MITSQTMNMHLPNGTLLQGGKYKIVRFISSGGFGCTYKAEHMMLQTEVAIKEFFVKDFCNRDETTAHVTVGTTSKKGLVNKLRGKFIEEARAIFQMHHPHIVRVIDIFEENGTAYYVMDYVDGMSLHDMVKQRGALREDEAVKYISQVAEALRYVHEKSRLHLDVKPSNIMIDNNGNAILIDFGTSKQYDEADGENTSTLMGKTPGYAPIEQMGNDVVKFTPATDIYALGATLYKLITGVTPLSANLLAGGEELAPLPNGTSKNISMVIASSMRIRKTDRPQNIKEFLSMLDSAPTTIGEETIFDATIVKKNGRINGYECVDLGLSVKWATCNVGASSPSDYGNYYAWGETKTKSEYTKENSVTYGKNMNSIKGNPAYDVARANCGSTWRLPTKDEIDELINKCKWQWTSQGGHNGYKVTGPNGNSIFLPAAGWRSGTSLNYAEKIGDYWSASAMPYGNNTYNAYGLYFYGGYFNRYWSFRSDGRSVRPVSE